MVLASKIGKIVHNHACMYAKRIKHRKELADWNEALGEGFRLCSCCSPVRERYERGRQLFDITAKYYHLKLYLKEGLLHIHDGVLDWILICSFHPKTFLLFHENGIYKYAESNIPGYPHIRGYHKQKYSSPNINEILIYIEGHKKIYTKRIDCFSLEEKKKDLLFRSRPKSPEHNVPKKHRYSKRKKAKRKFNTIAAFYVLDLIDSLFPYKGSAE